jgi:hypothetical protein
VVGQDRAVAQLQRRQRRYARTSWSAAGSGIEEAARCFAAAVVAPDGSDRSWDLVLRGIHPTWWRSTARDPDPEWRARAIVEVSRSPIEGERKVILCSTPSGSGSTRPRPASC